MLLELYVLLVAKVGQNHIFVVLILLVAAIIGSILLGVAFGLVGVLWLLVIVLVAVRVDVCKEDILREMNTL